MTKVITKNDLEQFAVYLYESEKSQNTIDKYLRDLRAFLAFADHARLTKALLLEYKAKLMKDYAVASVNSMIAALNVFLRFLGLQELCLRHLKVQKQTYCPEEKELTKQEYLALVHTAEKRHNERLSLVLQTICGTGIRVSELSFITVEAVQRGEAIVSCKNKTRTVFIVSKLCKKLLNYAKEHRIRSGSIFVTPSGKPLDRSNIWSDMKKLCKEAGVNPKKVFPHNLRHLFARTFYGIEKDIAKLADILGHSNINTTRIYIMTTGVEHRRKIETMRLIL